MGEREPHDLPCLTRSAPGAKPGNTAFIAIPPRSHMYQSRVQRDNNWNLVVLRIPLSILEKREKHQLNVSRDSNGLPELPLNAGHHPAHNTTRMLHRRKNGGVKDTPRPPILPFFLH